jgi:hypothetical protein
MQSKPDLKGPLILSFGQKAGPSIDVTIVGHPDGVLVKKKHYWLYSSIPCGKSTTIQRDLIDKFNAAWLRNPKNANIPASTQFIVLDDATPRHCIPYGQLRGLAGGFADHSCLETRRFPGAFIPRKDAQFIILSRKSPYEVYADKRMGRMEYMSTLSIEARFHIINLDGNRLDDRIRFADPKALSQDEFDEALFKILYDRLEHANKSGCLRQHDVRDSLARAYNLYVRRHEIIACHELFLDHLRDLLHKDDYPVYEAVHKKYMKQKGYAKVGNRVETIVRVPVMQRPTKPEHAPVEPVKMEPAKMEPVPMEPANLEPAPQEPAQ